MPILGTLWAIARAYSPNAPAQRREERRARRFGAFKPTYAPPAWHRRPRNDREAQQMYNHIRTVAFYLDAAPILSDLGLPFRAGLDDIISLVPLYGDIVSGILQLYQVALCFIFGVPVQVCFQMIINVILDVLVGIVPIIGDVLDNLFKSNLRNLQVLEKWLLSPSAGRYHILLMPDTSTFMPNPRRANPSSSSWSAWFGLGSSGRMSEANGESERERVSGKIRKTRRMEKHEAGATFGLGEEPRSHEDEMEDLNTGSNGRYESAYTQSGRSRVY